MRPVYLITKSSRSDKKLMVTLPDGTKIHFGQTGYSDYTLHRDKARRERYINRHYKHEKWNKSGVNTAGFWAYWILWNKKSVKSSAINTSKKFGIRIIVK
jgi:hypothetical protein